MNVLENTTKQLAIQYGVFNEICVLNQRSFDMNLQAFAQAVIEDYRAGLMPVGYIHDNGTEEFFLTKTCEKCIPLYALPSGETK